MSPSGVWQSDVEKGMTSPAGAEVGPSATVVAVAAALDRSTSGSTAPNGAPPSVSRRAALFVFARAACLRWCGESSVTVTSCGVPRGARRGLTAGSAAARAAPTVTLSISASAARLAAATRWRADGVPGRCARGGDCPFWVQAASARSVGDAAAEGWTVEPTKRSPVGRRPPRCTCSIPHPQLVVPTISPPAGSAAYKSWTDSAQDSAPTCRTRPISRVAQPGLSPAHRGDVRLPREHHDVPRLGGRQPTNGGKAGTIGRLTLFASHNSVRSNSVQPWDWIAAPPISRNATRWPASTPSSACLSASMPPGPARSVTLRSSRRRCGHRPA